MKIIAISDTHGQHHALKQLPAGDMLIHAGDISRNGKENQVLDFLYWFAKQDYQYKIFIAGNHDFFFEREDASYIQQLIPEDILYLNDSGIEIEGLNIWGSPVQPWFYDWAFNRARGTDIQQHWDLIPAQTDLLITHGPPMGILDATVRREHVGCAELMQTVEKIKPQAHVFGHIHEAYGRQQVNETTFINASVLNLHYQLTNAPVVFELESKKGH